MSLEQYTPGAQSVPGKPEQMFSLSPAVPPINFGVLSETYHVSASSSSPIEHREELLYPSTGYGHKHDNANRMHCKQWPTLQMYDTSIIHDCPRLAICLSFILLNWTLWQRNCHKMIKSFAHSLLSFQPE